MTQVGFKISLPGYSVETATPEQCSIHSSYDSLKVKVDNTNPQLGNITVTFQDNPGVGTYQLYQVKHSYGYEPDVYFFFDFRSSSGSTSLPTNETGSIFNLDESGDEYFQVVVDDNYMTFNFVVLTNADTVSGNIYNFRYYIFANNGP